MILPDTDNEEGSFAEFRRKVQEAGLLSAATQRLLQTICFTGKLSINVWNGTIQKSTYEEAYSQGK